MEELTEAVWQRVRKSLPVSFCAMAQREAVIAGICQQLWRLGANQTITEKLYQQAQRRKKELQSMARLSGEPDWEMPTVQQKADLSLLMRNLAMAAADYDPGHPIFGGVLEQYRQECIKAQRVLLTL